MPTNTQTYDLLGWATDGPILDLDHTVFGYAGKFRTPRTGKAVARDENIVAAACFNDDRAYANALRIRYLTVREDRRGEAIGPRLAAFVRRRARDRGYDRVRIAVNNPIAYDALYKTGFGYTGEERELGEVLLEAPDNQPETAYYNGLDAFTREDLPAAHRTVIDRGRDRGPPAPVTVP
ncbi:MAG: GNAT family N-acetyltransferase [Salinarchaeum sp.]